jgi:predicted PurR-regulated permease PerM
MVMGVLWGILGVALATPVAAAVIALAQSAEGEGVRREPPAEVGRREDRMQGAPRRLS